jgi:hypothetical protein
MLPVRGEVMRSSWSDMSTGSSGGGGLLVTDQDIAEVQHTISQMAREAAQNVVPRPPVPEDAIYPTDLTDVMCTTGNTRGIPVKVNSNWGKVVVYVWGDTSVSDAKLAEMNAKLNSTDPATRDAMRRGVWDEANLKQQFIQPADLQACAAQTMAQRQKQALDDAAAKRKKLLLIAGGVGGALVLGAGTWMMVR